MCIYIHLYVHVYRYSCVTTIYPRVLVYEVMQELYHQQRGNASLLATSSKDDRSVPAPAPLHLQMSRVPPGRDHKTRLQETLAICVMVSRLTTAVPTIFLFNLPQTCACPDGADFHWLQICLAGLPLWQSTSGAVRLGSWLALVPLGPFLTQAAFQNQDLLLDRLIKLFFRSYHLVSGSL